MKRSTRMLLMRPNTRRGREYPDAQRGYSRPQDYYGDPREFPGYAPEESRFRDRRGREHYDNGRYAPQNRMGGHPDKWDSWQYPHYRGPYEPPYYDGGQEERRVQKPMNRIGFVLDGQMERLPEESPHRYRSSMEYPPRDETRPQGGGEYTRGFGGSAPKLTKEMAEEWTQSMENEDGSHGPHWSMEQTNQVKSQKGIACGPIEFFVAMNMVYSDYAAVAKKLGANNVDFYACMAEAFLDDKDALPDKLARYYTYIVRH